MSVFLPSTDPTRFDVRDIPCRVKHRQIFDRWSALAVGEFFVLINDHDPVPLFYQFDALFPGAFTWEYLRRGPDEFQVRITRLARTDQPAAADLPRTCGSHGRDVLDVRPIPPRYKHERIFDRWRALGVGESFELLNDHDPVPLRFQFAAQFPGAFAWDYLATGPEEFRVRITKVAPGQGAAPTPRAPAAATGETSDGELLDVRGLEPPEPLIRIMNALETLPAGRRLRALTDRMPCHLYGEAEQRGFRHDSREQPDGSWITLLERA